MRRKSASELAALAADFLLRQSITERQLKQCWKSEVLFTRSAPFTVRVCVRERTHNSVVWSLIFGCRCMSTNDIGNAFIESNAKS